MSHAQKHEPVLLSSTLEYLDPKQGDRYLDLTAGYGGHAQAIINKTTRPERAVLVDRDREAIEFLKHKFKNSSITILHSNFYEAAKDLSQHRQQFDVILADLGVSSPHLDNAERGFSFNKEGPIDMRFDQNQSLTAQKIVNTFSKEQLQEIIKLYGEDPKASKIANAIVENRPFNTTTELARVIARTSRKKSKIHPATKSFQALRIAVNQELELLSKSIPLWIDLLAPGGRLAIISFHSLEDRLVKQMFEEYGGDRYDAELRILTKKPVVGKPEEIVHNPRARSAKLRAVAKINT